MARPVALGAAGGSLTTFLLALLKESFDHHHPSFVHFPRVPECVCPNLPTLLEQVDNPGLLLFLTGLTVGVGLGFFLDLLWIAKERWRRLIFGDLTRAPAGARSLHKVLE